MANTNAPYGFMPVRRIDGAAWTGNQSVKKIAYDYTTPIYKGDCVAVTNAGTIIKAPATPTGHLTYGVFLGCKYLATANNQITWSNYWPGSGNVGTGSIEAYVVDDPNVLFSVQSSGAAITQADVGFNADIVLGTGNALTGQSGSTINQATLAVTATFPFRIYSLVEGVGPGTDATSSYNRVLVAWNDQFLRQMAGI